ncbi:MAG TPA: DHA2 family efflux MFS transporter permease subunit [Acidimicrobiales bacterium]|nr:DHA2 family efflux MFS transporter permease subunit [Acidimicrobiales bacterium]
MTHAPDQVAPTATYDIEGITERYRWTALSIVLIGTFMVILDTTIVTVALDPIGTSIHAPNGVEWIITAYLLAVGVVQPVTGWAADRVGRKPVFIWSMVLFAGGSLACAMAPNLGVIIFFRVLQGLGGGAMLPVGMAIIYELFPPDRRGMAMGIWGVAAMSGPAIGPVLGGWLVTQFDWRWLFLVNLPIGVIGTLLAAKVLRNNGFREARPLDWTGLAIVTIGLVAVLLALSEGASWGWTSTATIVAASVGAALLVLFGRWSLRHAEFPLIDLRMFRISIYSLTIAVICLMTLSQYGRIVFIPLELEGLRSLTPLRTGLILAPTALGAAITMPIGGRLADRIGARIPVTLGLIPVAAATWYFAHLTPSSSETTLMIWMFVSGVGFGIAMMPNTVTGLNSLPSRLIATGSATRQLCRQVFGSVAVAGLTAVVASQLGGHVTSAGAGSVEQAQAAYNDVFLLGFWFLIATIGVALFLPGKRVAMGLHEARRLEQEAMTANLGPSGSDDIAELGLLELDG